MGIENAMTFSPIQVLGSPGDPLWILTELQNLVGSSYNTDRAKH